MDHYTLDSNSQHGIEDFLSLFRTILTDFVLQGIAVHPELTYSVVRTSAKEGVLFVAKDRLVALEHVIGPYESIAELKGTDLVGARYRSVFSPINCSEMTRAEIITASHVTSESGSGLVHCAPAHGAEDYLAFRALGLLQGSTDIVCHVDDAGKFSADVAHVVGEEAAQTLVGQEVLKGGCKAIVKLLESAGSLVKVQKIKHRYPYDWKTGEPIIVTLVHSLHDVVYFGAHWIEQGHFAMVCQPGQHQG
jgi:isoleucyl-tRNA synthetase